MKCPRCGQPLRVMQTREDGSELRRVRRCAQGHVFMTLEAPLRERPTGNRRGQKWTGIPSHA